MNCAIIVYVQQVVNTCMNHNIIIIIINLKVCTILYNKLIPRA